MANLVRNKPSDETDNSLHAVADADRMPRYSLTMAWWAVCTRCSISSWGRRWR